MSADWIRRRARVLWDRTPGTAIETLLLWAFGLALGGLAFWTTIALPLHAAIAVWACAVGLGLLMARRAEPILWEESGIGERDAEAEAEPGRDQTPRSEPPPVPPLLDMVQIPGGTFRMGSPEATEAQVADFAGRWGEAFGSNPEEQMRGVRDWLAREQPAHRVGLSPFLMARVPVTRAQWRAILREVPREWSESGEDDDLPATHVDWPQAIAFCNALSLREGLTPCYRQDARGDWQWDRAAPGYRLPTEAEWEYACRAGTQTQWFWGDDAEGADAHAWYNRNAEGQLRPVGCKAANPWGLHDMTGLAWEWCWDRYGAYPRETSTPTQDPAGPLEGDRRVVRGGSFGFPPGDLRSAGRGFDWPDFRSDDLGLRCVRSRARQP